MSHSEDLYSYVRFPVIFFLELNASIKVSNLNDISGNIVGNIMILEVMDIIYKQGRLTRDKKCTNMG